MSSSTALDEAIGPLAEIKSTTRPQLSLRGKSVPYTNSSREAIARQDGLQILTKLKKQAVNSGGASAEIGVGDIEMLIKVLEKHSNSIEVHREEVLATRFESSLTEEGFEADDPFTKFMLITYTGTSRKLRGKKRFKELAKLALLKTRLLKKKDLKDGGKPGSAREQRRDLARKTSSEITGTEHLDAATLDSIHLKINEWNFDVFALAKLIPQPLTYVGTALLGEHDLIKKYNMPTEKLRGFLDGVRMGYNENNPYHNALHGTDVAVSSHYIMTHTGLSDRIDPTMSEATMATIIAGLVHDMGHPGFNNGFLNNTMHDLAIRYNDRSPLENMHASEAFALIKRKECNFLENMTRGDFKHFRKMCISMVLATDMAAHAKHVEDLKLMCDRGVDFNNPSDQLLLLSTALHASDISNPAKAMPIYMAWTDRVVAEFYAQGDQERKLGMAVTPNFDRKKPVPIEKAQYGFIQFAVKPLFDAFARVPGIDLKVCLDQLNKNHTYWKTQVSRRKSQVAAGVAKSAAAAAAVAAAGKEKKDEGK